MQIQIKSSRGITLIPEETLLLADRKIFLEGDITQPTACRFMRQVMLLTKDDRTKPINVFINSCGGEINAGMLIYDVIQSSLAPLRLICTGQAYSMGAILFAGGNNGRYMLPHSELMLHEPLLGNRVGGNSSSIKSISESLTETKNKLNVILSKHTGQKVSVIEEATRFDHYFTPEEAVAFGLCDKIIDFSAIMEG